MSAHSHRYVLGSWFVDGLMAVLWVYWLFEGSDGGAGPYRAKLRFFLDFCLGRCGICPLEG
jgi:hypothetical protein